MSGGRVKQWRLHWDLYKSQPVPAGHIQLLNHSTGKAWPGLAGVGRLLRDFKSSFLKDILKVSHFSAARYTLPQQEFSPALLHLETLLKYSEESSDFDMLQMK